jgi:hypothetical protein
MSDGQLIAIDGCGRCRTGLDLEATDATIDPEWGVIWVGTPN